MRSPILSTWILFSILTLSLSAQTTKESPLSPEKQKLLKERDRLYAEIPALFRAKKISEGMERLHEVLALEKQIYGDSHHKVISRWKQIAQLYEKLSQWKETQRALQEVQRLLIEKEGKDTLLTQRPQSVGRFKPLPPSGILITSVIVDSIADKAGLQSEHVLLEYNGTQVNSIEELNNAKMVAQNKKEVRITIWDAGKTFEKSIPTGQLGVVLSKQPAKIALQNRRKQQWQLVSRGDTWNALPGTRIEVASISDLMDKDQRQVLLDSEASEQQLHQLAITDKLKEFKYLHFATHGKVNRFLPMESALILSRDNLKGNVAELKANEPYFDGRLTAKEVALHWTLDADLVTLSACESGLGKHAKGEGYMGFAQSFLIRGSRSVVLSLWSVDDTATALLMSRFYENLIKRNMSKIDALREAKKWLRTLPQSEVLKLAASMSNGVARGPGRKKLPSLSKEPMSDKADDAPYAHPYYWSAFILIGDPH